MDFYHHYGSKTTEHFCPQQQWSKEKGTTKWMVAFYKKSYGVSLFDERFSQRPRQY
jgi:hypothetical protein